MFRRMNPLKPHRFSATTNWNSQGNAVCYGKTENWLIWLTESLQILIYNSCSVFLGTIDRHIVDQQGWYGMFVACGIWCLADVSSVSPSSKQTQVCSDEGLTLETSAKHHIPQATNIPYQPSWSNPYSACSPTQKNSFFQN